MTYRWPKPQGVATAMTLPELELLQDYAHDVAIPGLNDPGGGKPVLEIGALYGFSTIGMALIGAHVTSVDPHYDGPITNPDTWGLFTYNIRTHHIENRIKACRMSSFDWHQQEPPDTLFGLVFVDGDHTWPQPWYDCRMAHQRLMDDGYIALHDVHVNWPGVQRAAKLLESEGLAKQVAAEGCLRVYQKSASSVSGASIKPAVAL